MASKSAFRANFVELFQIDGSDLNAHQSEMIRFMGSFVATDVPERLSGLLCQ